MGLRFNKWTTLSYYINICTAAQQTTFKKTPFKNGHTQNLIISHLKQRDSI